MRPPPHPAWYILVRRLREVEVHHVDLGAGYGPADWPETFVHRDLHDCLLSWPHAQSTVSEIRLRDGRTWRGLGSGPAVEGGAADVLAWLIGRSDGEGVRVVTVGRLSTPVPVAPPGCRCQPPLICPRAPEGLSMTYTGDVQVGGPADVRELPKLSI